MMKKKRYIQPEAEFGEIEGLDNLLNEGSKRVMVGETPDETSTVTDQGDVVDVKDGDDDGLF